PKNKPKLEASPKAQTGAVEQPEAAPDGTLPVDGISETPTVTFDDAIKNTRKIEGLFTLYKNDETGELFLELSPKQLNENFLLVMTLSRGIGEAGLLSGLPLGDVLFQFRRRNENIEFVIPNFYLRNRPDDPSSRARDRSFSESVLYSLPVVALHPERNTLLLDARNLLLQRDISGLSEILPYFLGGGYGVNSEQSYINTVDAFPGNIEIESVQGFSGSGSPYLNTLPDNRAFSLGIHYSISELPNDGYKPRLADERIGYFITAYRNLADDTSRDPFVRYIQRWHLEKQDPTAELSPPKEPIVFWIENTVPPEYRDAIREGILMWNPAFEKAGFLNAIEVRQMPDDADWRPEDIRYNTIRWSTSFESMFAGIGPSRINPLTGQILDADILIDANVVRFAQKEWTTYLGSETAQSELAGEFCQVSNELCQSLSSNPPIDPSALSDRLPFANRQRMGCSCPSCTQQAAMGVMALSLLQDAQPGDATVEEYLNQYLRYLVSHEVGHTLGLRHNFHGSTLLTPEELNNPEITRTMGMVSSVMDYTPANLAPPGQTQGDFFPMLVGPYDNWAIEYGYKVSPNPRREGQFLENIAQRAPKRELAYGTDEDVWSQVDPAVTAFDLSSDPLLYSQGQMENARQMWTKLNDRVLNSGAEYSEQRERFNLVLVYYFNQAMTITRYIGGQSFNRDRAGDPGGRLPFEPIPVEKQRESLSLLEQYVFAPNAFEFSPQLLNQLAPSRWSHWGSEIPVLRLDYPIHDIVLLVQGMVLNSLLDGERLGRLRDLEVKTPPGEALTVPELFETLHRSIWMEVLQAEREATPITSFRRSLQREHLNLLIQMVLGEAAVPEDARTLAWYQLNQLGDDIRVALRRRGDDMDTYTKAHLEETRDRLIKALDAEFQTN
ncbi:MAG: zinc-dependent metalloprotease, partial [Geitlerinemataceae cyanobacterium]